MDTAEVTGTRGLQQPILIGIDAASWDEKIDAVERWLGNATMVQSGFRRLAEDVRDKLHEPHFRDLVSEIVETAKRHEQLTEALYDAIGRQQPTSRQGAGEWLSPLRRAWADALGATGSAAAPFRDLQQLLMASLNATTVYATAEQLGLAMGIQQLAELSFQIVAEKYPHHLVLQEIALESAATAILYHTELAGSGAAEAPPEPTVRPAAASAGVAAGAAAALAVMAGLTLRDAVRRRRC